MPSIAGALPPDPFFYERAQGVAFSALKEESLPDGELFSLDDLISRVAAVFFQVIEWIGNAISAGLEIISNALDGCCVSSMEQEVLRQRRALESYSKTCKTEIDELKEMNRLVEDVLETIKARQLRWDELDDQMPPRPQDIPPSIDEKQIATDSDGNPIQVELNYSPSPLNELMKSWKNLVNTYPLMPKEGELTVQVIQSTEQDRIEHHNRVVANFHECMELLKQLDEKMIELLLNKQKIAQETRSLTD